ncbi:MAG: acyl-CoA dehydrogenase [Candidatus Binatia bacterium]|nr:MAG: acyl-CoA dehydrogenase [Candidatus Binatia bacterium]
MNFDFSEDQKLLQKTAREYLEKHCPVATARAVLEGGEPFARRLWAEIGELGWLATAVPTSFGGAGFGALELCLLAYELGRALAPVPFSSTAYLAIEALLVAGSEEQKARFLPELATGTKIGTLAFVETPGRTPFRNLETRVEHGRLHGKKLVVPDAVAADLAVVVAREGDRTVLAVAELASDRVRRVPLASIDPSRPVGSLEFRGASCEVLAESGEDVVAHVFDRAAALFAFEQLGGAERAFASTREYCLERYAFGRPVASFQAIKHRFADLFVGLELARSNAYYAAWALAEAPEELRFAAPNARIAASEVFELASTEMIQLHGGVGFTWEYDCHLFYRRAKALGLVLGSPRFWKDLLVRRLAGPADS